MEHRETRSEAQRHAEFDDMSPRDHVAMEQPIAATRATRGSARQAAPKPLTSQPLTSRTRPSNERPSNKSAIEPTAIETSATTARQPPTSRGRVARGNRVARPLQKRPDPKRRAPIAVRRTWRNFGPVIHAVDCRSCLSSACCCSHAVIGRVVFLQTAGSDALLAAGKAQRVSESVLVAERGTIFARDGGELALSVSSSTLWANPKLVVDPAGTASLLTTMLHLSAEKQQTLLRGVSRPREKSFVYIIRQIDDDLAATVLGLSASGS